MADTELAAQPLLPTQREDEDGSDAFSEFESESESEQGGEDEVDRPPVAKKVDLADHRKAISAIDLDPSGARLISGSYDYSIKLWDFAGMDTAFRPFRSFEPFGEYQIKDLAYSATGDRFVAASGASFPLLFDRDGQELQRFAKGDMYIRDPRQTSGHTMALTRLGWHPTDRATFYTASNDGTVRLWDVENKRKQKQVWVIRPKTRAARVSVDAALMAPDGRTLVVATNDGCLSIWPTRGNPNKPQHCIDGAHAVGSEVTALVRSIDGHTLASRATDDTVKLWDLRNFRNPLATRTGLPVRYGETGLAFSPADRYIVTGVAPAPKDGGAGSLVFLDKATLETRHTVDLAGTANGPVALLWHSRLNQIACGTSQGTIHVYYDESASIRGAKLGAARIAKPQFTSVSYANPTIITPHALPLFRDQETQNKRRPGEKARKQAEKHKIPERPIHGHGHGGRMGLTETQHIMKNIVKNTTFDEDPREALLKYAKEAEENPYWIAPAYQQNQPKPVFSEDTDEPEAKRSKRA
ncbi:hypothetical protein IWQ60_006738 [Tieghemiomyces parasiticus]|uniref:Uncharacterized protein n=1 Tax=Tieghemiomyces parasiticus TaxID=78921 RepID=A0A9W8A368_9FUNG|nr:hypothetical protein IWQ60_006738 [Tieghemiomyces parasiticus]